MRLGLGEIMLLRKVEGAERTVVRAEHRLRVALKQERQRATGRADIDGLPEAVQHQNVLV